MGGGQAGGTVGVKWNPSRNKENILVHCMSAQNECRGKVLIFQPLNFYKGF